MGFRLRLETSGTALDSSSTRSEKLLTLAIVEEILDLLRLQLDGLICAYAMSFLAHPHI